MKLQTDVFDLLTRNTYIKKSANLFKLVQSNPLGKRKVFNEYINNKTSEKDQMTNNKTIKTYEQDEVIEEVFYKKSNEPGSIDTQNQTPNLIEPFETFEELFSKLDDLDLMQLKKNLKTLNYIKPTIIQANLIPVILNSKNSGCVGAAPTGSGKTLAYSLPTILNTLYKNINEKLNFCLILLPNKELAIQTYEHFKKLCNCIEQIHIHLLDTYLNNSNKERHIDILILSLEEIDLVIQSSDKIQLGNCERIIVDEFDKLLTKQHIKTIDCLLHKINKSENPNKLKQSIVLSATMPNKDNIILQLIAPNPVYVQHKTIEYMPCNIKQELLYCLDMKDKLNQVVKILEKDNPWSESKILIFINNNSKSGKLLIEKMNSQSSTSSILIETIDENVPKDKRIEKIEKLKKGDIKYAVFSDILNRGLDIESVDTVINLDIPTDSKNYIHRGGRCGRMGRQGRVVTLFTRTEAHLLKDIVNVMRISNCKIPDWYLSINFNKQKKNNKYKNKQPKTRQ